MLRNLERWPMILVLLIACSSGLVRAQEEIIDPNPKPIFEKLPADFEVIAVGTYSGIHPAKGVQLDESGHQVKYADVCVNRTEKPVVLVLTAYDPIAWRVCRTKGTTIAGVIVSGYHGQALTGIEKETPHVVVSYYQKGEFKPFYAYNAGPELRNMLKQVKAMLGRDVSSMVIKPKEGTYYVGEPPTDPKDVVIADGLPIKAFVKPDLPPAGPDALKALEGTGAIRLATQEDIDAWVDKASEEFRHLNPDLKVEHHMMRGRTYVVVGEFEMPKGLFGAHSRAFIIPEGAPLPTGNSGHCEFYYLMDGTREGPGERAQKR